MSQSLFEQLGGAEVVAQIVETMYENVLADPDLGPFFANTNLERLRKMQFEFIASALGGPVAYSGAELQAIHAGRGITAKHFAKFVTHLSDSMASNGASPENIDAMLGEISMYRDRIIGSANVDG